MSAQGPTLAVRRAGWFTALNLAFGAMLVVITIINLVDQLQAGSGWALAAMFAAIAGFFCWQAWTQFYDRAPVVEIGPAGLGLPSAAEEPIPWSRILHAHAGAGLAGLSGGRIDFQVDTETYAKLRFGQRFMGDVVVRRRGIPNAFSIMTQGLDTKNAAIFAAMSRYWPPERADHDE